MNSENMNVFLRLTNKLSTKFLLPLFSFLVTTPLTGIIKFLNAIAKKIEGALIEVEKVAGTETEGAEVFSIYTGRPATKNIYKINNGAKRSASFSIIPGGYAETADAKMAYAQHNPGQVHFHPGQRPKQPQTILLS